MDWNTIETMDPHLLVGVVNTALRNHYTSLEDLCKSRDIDSQRLCARLAEQDYQYLPAANQFR